MKCDCRILALMKDATSSVSLENVKMHHLRNLPSTHASLSNVDKSIILARVEVSVEVSFGEFFSHLIQFSKKLTKLGDFILDFQK